MAALDALGLPQGSEGSRLYDLDLWATIAFCVAAFASALAPGPLRIPFAVLSCVLFAAGIVAFLMAYGQAVQRSRTHQLSVAGIYGMAESTPGPVRWRFHVLTAAQTGVALATAAMRPFTAQAFGILVPMLGLGLGGLWAVRHGTFSPRRDRRRRPQTTLDQEAPHE